MTRIPYRFEPTATAADVVATHGGLEPGVETGEVVTLSLIHI